MLQLELELDPVLQLELELDPVLQLELELVLVLELELDPVLQLELPNKEKFKIRKQKYYTFIVKSRGGFRVFDYIITFL